MKETKMRYIAHVPLAGGYAIGNMNITGEVPIAITSYSAFLANDTLYTRFIEKRGFDIPYYQLDKMSDEEIAIMIESFGHIDFVTAIPPCSGLSQAAQRKAGSRGTAAPNDWMYESANFILSKVKPTIYSFENAPGLYTGAGDDVRARLIKIGEENGYAITFYKTNTLKHGIPQFRPRTFAIFYKGKNAPILHSYNKTPVHIIDYLNDIPATAKHQDEYMVAEWDITKFEIYRYLQKHLGYKWREEMTNFRPHLTTYDYLMRKGLLDDFQEWQKKLPDDERSDIVTKNIEHIKKKRAMGMGARINYRVLGIDRDYVYAVIGEMMGKEVHPTEDRLMNIREFMHLMGLPMDYELDGQKEYAKISQNVPTCTCEDMTREIVAIIKGERLFSNQSVLMQDNSKEFEIKQTVQLF